MSVDARPDNSRKQSTGTDTLISQREAAEEIGWSKRQPSPVTSNPFWDLGWFPPRCPTVRKPLAQMPCQERFQPPASLCCAALTRRSCSLAPLAISASQRLCTLRASRRHASASTSLTLASSADLSGFIVGARTEQRMLPRLAPSGAVEGLDRCKLLVGERLAVASIPQRLRSTVKLDHLIGEQELTRSASGPSHGSSFQQDDRQPLSVPGSLPGARCICSRTLGRLTHHAAADWP
jgi:hypothetical protein